MTDSSIKPVSYTDVKARVIKVARDVRNEVRTELNNVTTSQSYIDAKTEITTGAKKIETEYVEPAFNAISKETTRLIEKHREPVTNFAKNLGKRISNAWRNI